MGDLIGPRIVGWLNWPFFAWNSCFPETSISGTLHLLYVLLIHLHFVVVKTIGRNCAKTPFALTAVSSLRARSWGRGEGYERRPRPPRACSQSYGPEEQLHRINWRNCRAGAGQRSAEQGVHDCHWLPMPKPLSTFFIFSHISLFQTHFYTLKISKIIYRFSQG